MTELPKADFCARYGFKSLERSEATFFRIIHNLSSDYVVAQGEGWKTNECEIRLKDSDEVVGNFICNVGGSAFVTLYVDKLNVHKSRLEAMFSSIAKKQGGILELTQTR